MNIKRLIKKVSCAILICLVLSYSSVLAFSLSNPNDERIENSAEIFTEGCYYDGEVIIELKDNDETRQLELCSYYSDNIEFNGKGSQSMDETSLIVEPTQSAKNVLGINLSITEMEMLNPSKERTQEGKYVVSEAKNNSFLIKYSEDISVNDAIEELSNSGLIEYAQPIIRADTSIMIRKYECIRQYT